MKGSFMNMKNVKYVFAGLLLVPATMFGLWDGELYSLIKNGSGFAKAHPEIAQEFMDAYDRCHNSRVYKNCEIARSAEFLLAPSLEEDGALPISMICGSFSLDGVIKDKQLEARSALSQSEEVKSLNKSFDKARYVFYRWEDKIRGR